MLVRKTAANASLIYLLSRLHGIVVVVCLVLYKLSEVKQEHKMIAWNILFTMLVVGYVEGEWCMMFSDDWIISIDQNIYHLSPFIPGLLSADHRGNTTLV